MREMWLVTCDDSSDDRWFIVTADDANGAAIAAANHLMDVEPDGQPWACWYVYRRNHDVVAILNWQINDMFLDEPEVITIDGVDR